MDWNQMRAMVDQTNEPYKARKIESFSDAVQTFKEVSPDYSALHTRARHLAHKNGYVNADMLRENSQDIIGEGKKIIFGTILNSRNFQEGGRVTSNVKGSHGRKISNWQLKGE